MILIVIVYVIMIQIEHVFSVEIVKLKMLSTNVKLLQKLKNFPMLVFHPLKQENKNKYIANIFSTFKYISKRNTTALSKLFWDLKDRNKQFTLDWQILSKSSPYDKGKSLCPLIVRMNNCLSFSSKHTLFNTYKELVYMCLHWKEHTFSYFRYICSLLPNYICNFHFILFNLRTTFFSLSFLYIRHSHFYLLRRPLLLQFSIFLPSLPLSTNDVTFLNDILNIASVLYPLIASIHYII